MSLAELLPAARALDDGDKLRLIRELADDLAREEEIRRLIPPGVEFPVWSAFENYEAAAVLQKFLDEPEKGS